MRIIRVVESENNFCSLHWSVEHSWRYVLVDDSDAAAYSPIEVGYYIHYGVRGGRRVEVKRAIELSSSSGCPMGCKYCASGSLPAIEFLSADSICEAFELVYAERHERCSDGEGLPLRVTYTGIGELRYVMDSVEESVGRLNARHNGLSFTLSTCCLDPLMLSRVEAIASNAKLHCLQVTLASSDPRIVASLVDYYQSERFDVHKLVGLIQTTTLPLVRINYVVVGGRNDSDAEFESIAQTFAPVASKVSFRVSSMNETMASRRNRLVPPDPSRCDRLVRILVSRGIRAYAYRAMRDDCMNCGQLVSEYKAQTGIVV